MRTLMIAAFGLAVLSGPALAQTWTDDNGRGWDRGHERQVQAPGHGYGRKWRRDRYDDDDDDGWRERRWRERRAWREGEWGGNCRVRRFWDGDGYRELRTCRHPEGRW